MESKPPRLPRLSNAQTLLTHDIDIVDETGASRRIAIPVERPLTLYVDKREIVTLMTLGQHPEWMVLGYLLNQRLVADLAQVAAVSVDWDSQAAAVRTHAGLAADVAALTDKRVVTTGCGQGTVYEHMTGALDAVRLPEPAQSAFDAADLVSLLETARAHPSLHRQAGSVHGCALFAGTQMLLYVEDVGRHNAVDTVAGWMAMHGVAGGDKLFYTTGRLTSEMVMKAALMGLPTLVSRNGITAMGHRLALQLGMTLIGRASGRRFLCYCGAQRMVGSTQAAIADPADP
jgi:FdhD protein